MNFRVIATLNGEIFVGEYEFFDVASSFEKKAVSLGATTEFEFV
jgi:hypothetical protein